MHANSRPVYSNQAGPHEKLAGLVQKHARAPFRKPPAPYSMAAFELVLRAWDGRQPLLLDSACGTGASTLALARLHPECLAIGVDQSEQRLSQGRRAEDAPANALLLRADVVDIWTLLARQGMRLAHHYLLYPNPWPKSAQVMRRWPAHPAFPAMLTLGGKLECRSNWEIYVREFALALQALRGAAPEVTRIQAQEPLTPFERKYRDSGHALWRAAVDLDEAALLREAA